MEYRWDKLIVALDVTSGEKLKRIVEELSPKVDKFKVGLIAYTKFGPEVVSWIKNKNCRIFMDFKLFDIPNTMAETAKVFIDLGVWAFTVHLKAGVKSLKFLKEEITKEADARGTAAPLVIGVTELTSREASSDRVLELARDASLSNLDGVVCSVWEARKVKEEFGLVTITPGIRAEKGGDDQVRTATMKDALENNADYCVVGRPIIKGDNYLEDAERIVSV